MQRTLGTVGPAFRSGGVEQGKQLPNGPPNPIHPLWMADMVTCSSLQLGNRLIPWGNFSAEAELLRADCRYTVLWKILLLKKSTKEKEVQLEKVGFARGLGFISADNKRGEEDREKAATDNAGGVASAGKSSIVSRKAIYMQKTNQLTNKMRLNLASSLCSKPGHY